MSEKELITEFLLAAEQGNADGLKSCLAKNVDINATNRQGAYCHYYCQPE